MKLVPTLFSLLAVLGAASAGDVRGVDPAGACLASQLEAPAFIKTAHGQAAQLTLQWLRAMSLLPREHLLASTARASSPLAPSTTTTATARTAQTSPARLPVRAAQPRTSSAGTAAISLARSWPAASTTVSATPSAATARTSGRRVLAPTAVPRSQRCTGRRWMRSRRHVVP